MVDHGKTPDYSRFATFWGSCDGLVENMGFIFNFNNQINK